METKHKDTALEGRLSAEEALIRVSKIPLKKIGFFFDNPRISLKEGFYHVEDPSGYLFVRDYAQTDIQRARCLYKRDRCKPVEKREVIAIPFSGLFERRPSMSGPGLRIDYHSLSREMWRWFTQGDNLPLEVDENVLKTGIFIPWKNKNISYSSYQEMDFTSGLNDIFLNEGSFELEYGRELKTDPYLGATFSCRVLFIHGKGGFEQTSDVNEINKLLMENLEGCF